LERKPERIGEPPEFFGVTVSTLRRWEREGQILADECTVSGIATL
jgi:DNA-binding transcriptional MerR regulator